MTFQEMLEKVPTLSLEERKALMHVLIDLMQEPAETHSILELEGLGAEYWQDIDAQAFINQLRSEWHSS